MADGAFCHYCKRARCVCKGSYWYEEMEKDLAAARGARDRLRDALEQIARHSSQEHYNDTELLNLTLRHIDRVARAALEKANG